MNNIIYNLVLILCFVLYFCLFAYEFLRPRILIQGTAFDTLFSPQDSPLVFQFFFSRRGTSQGFVTELSCACVHGRGLAKLA